MIYGDILSGGARIFRLPGHSQGSLLAWGTVKNYAFHPYSNPYTTL